MIKRNKMLTVVVLTLIGFGKAHAETYLEDSQFSYAVCVQLAKLPDITESDYKKAIGFSLSAMNNSLSKNSCIEKVMEQTTMDFWGACGMYIDAHENMKAFLDQIQNGIANLPDSPNKTEVISAAAVYEASYLPLAKELVDARAKLEPFATMVSACK